MVVSCLGGVLEADPVDVVQHRERLFEVPVNTNWSYIGSQAPIGIGYIQHATRMAAISRASHTGRMGVKNGKK